MKMWWIVLATYVHMDDYSEKLTDSWYPENQFKLNVGMLELTPLFQQPQTIQQGTNNPHHYHQSLWPSRDCLQASKVSKDDPVSGHR